MNAKILGAFLLASLVSGCIVVKEDGSGGGAPPPPPAQPGDVTFTWSFSGGTCADVPYVKGIHVEIPGETLQNDGVYPCLANGYPGIVLHDFAPGTYTFTLDALDYSNQIVFQGSGTFTINGDARATVDLTPVGGPTSYAYLTWRFPANQASATPDCSQAGVSFVDVSLDDGAYVRFNCIDGFAQPGVTTPYLEPGQHKISLRAVNADGYPYYQYDGWLQTFAGNPVGADYQLTWAVGGAGIRWELTNGSVAQTCQQAGVTDVYVNFQNAQNEFLYPGAGDKQSCAAAPVFYDFLLPGTYRVFVQATGSGGTYLSNAQNPPMVTVQAGEFPDASIPVQMFRAN